MKQLVVLLAIVVGVASNLFAEEADRPRQFSIDSFKYAIETLQSDLATIAIDPKVNAAQRKTAGELGELISDYKLKARQNRVEMVYGAANKDAATPLGFSAHIQNKENRVFIPRVHVQSSFVRHYFTHRRITDAYILMTLAAVREMFRPGFRPSQALWTSFSMKSATYFFRYLELKENLSPSGDPMMVDALANFARGESSDAYLDMQTLVEGKNVRLEIALEGIAMENEGKPQPSQEVLLQRAARIIKAEFAVLDKMNIDSERALILFYLRGHFATQRSIEIVKATADEKLHDDLMTAGLSTAERLLKILADPKFDAKYQAVRDRQFRKDSQETTEREYKKFTDWLNKEQKEPIRQT